MSKANNLKVVEDCAHAIGTFQQLGVLAVSVFTQPKIQLLNQFKKFADKVSRSHGMLKSRVVMQVVIWVFDILEPGYIID